MTWLDYVQTNWRTIRFRYAKMRNAVPGRSWSAILSKYPRLDGNKLYMPLSVYLDAGYIDLDKHEIVYNKGVDEYGKLGLQIMFKELQDRVSKS